MLHIKIINDRGVNKQNSERFEKEVNMIEKRPVIPTIFFRSEQNGVAEWAVTKLRVRQHLQNIYCVLLEATEEQRQTSLSFYRFYFRGTFHIFLTVQHLCTKTNI